MKTAMLAVLALSLAASFHTSSGPAVSTAESDVSITFVMPAPPRPGHVDGRGSGGGADPGRPLLDTNHIALPDDIVYVTAPGMPAKPLPQTGGGSHLPDGAQTRKPAHKRGKWGGLPRSHRAPARFCPSPRAVP